MTNFNARLIISHVVIDALKALDIRYPEITAREAELREIRKQQPGKSRYGLCA